MHVLPSSRRVNMKFATGAALVLVSCAAVCDAFSLLGVNPPTIPSSTGNGNDNGNNNFLGKD